MHADARERLTTLVNEAEPRTMKARIRALAPLIEAARAKGIPWHDIHETLGVPRSTLIAALRGYAIPKDSAAAPAAASTTPAAAKPRRRPSGAP